MIIQHTVLFKFPSIETLVPQELAEVVDEFNALEGIVATLKPHGTSTADKAGFLARVGWPDKTEGYTHCLLILAKNECCLKAYLHSEAHLVKWMAVVKPYLKGIVVFDNEIDPSVLAAAQLLAGPAVGQKGGLCAAEGLAPASGLPAAGGEYAAKSDGEIADMVASGALKDHALEKVLGDCERAVSVRRLGVERSLAPRTPITGLPYKGYCYDQVRGANCEVVVGYVPLPCGLVGPLLVDGAPYLVPMATTEGCLVASTNRGAKAITQAGGCFSAVLKDGITRAPCLVLPSAMEAARLKAWIAEPDKWAKVKAAFESTTSFGKLRSADVHVAGRNAYVRFVCFAGDAMGMNMVSKGCLAAVALLQSVFPAARLVSISGNVCADKKPAAVNWIEGRGKSVVCEAVIPASVVKSTLKTSVAGMVDVAVRKNLVGSAVAGAMGGFNAHAANIVAAVFLACGQDPAQVVESANCITLVEALEPSVEGGEPDLHVSVTMPSIEVGTVGGGTALPAQAACLDLIGCRGAARGEGQAPGDHARMLGRVVAAATLAGELSLLAALASNDLVKSHMQHNRKPTLAPAPAAAAPDPEPLQVPPAPPPPAPPPPLLRQVS